MRKNLSKALLLMFVGLGCFGGGGYAIYAGLQKGKANDASLMAEAQSCLGKLTGIGAATLNGNDVVVTVDDVHDPRRSIADAVAAGALCPGHVLDNLCIGEACYVPQQKVPGTVPMSFTMKQIPASAR